MRDILIGERYRERLHKNLVYQGFTPIYIPDNPCVDPRLGGHIDLSIFQPEEKVLIIAGWLAGEARIVNYLTNSGYKIFEAENKQSTGYPHDANLCACSVGGRIIHNRKYTDPVIADNWPDKLIDVKQTYSKCSVCVVDENSIITADRAITDRAEDAGLNVLRISPGEIALEGFDTGFIGGASFADEKAVYFTGLLGSYRTAVELFIASCGKKTVYLTTEPAFDIGGAILL